MSYEPRGKMKALIDAMRAAAAERPVWNSTDVARVLETATASVPAFVDPSIRHGVLFRKLENGRSQYSLTPFAPAATEAPVYQTAPMAQRETTATGWKPPQMACTRPTAGTPSQAARSHDTVDGLPPGAPRIYPDEPREDALAKMAAAGAAREPAPCPPSAAPVLADASIQGEAGAAAEPALTIELDAPLDEQQEEAEPITWNIWEDGDLDLHGLVELEGGGHRLPAEALRRLRKFIAWMPA